MKFPIPNNVFARLHTGAAASKPFGFGAVQPPSDGQGFGTKPAVFGGAFGRAPSAGSTDVPAPQSVFGSKPAGAQLLTPSPLLPLP